MCGSDTHYWKGEYDFHRFPLERINEAFRQQEDGHITRGAIVPN